LLCLAAGIAAAQSTYQVTYYSNPLGASLDSTFHIVNPGTQVTEVDSNGKPLNGDLCADIYVYNNDEQVVECCGCRLTPDSERTLSLNTDLLANPINPKEVTTDGVIKIVSTRPNSSNQCDPTGDTGPTRLALEVQAWATHIQTNANNPETEEEFASAHLSPFELQYDQRLCSAIRTSGSRKGICTCGYGD
jgi:hypothetical protein